MTNENFKKGRPRSFDQEKILQAAMFVFWSHGFTQTSYNLLEEATGLRRQSLVYAFGDKRNLFLRSLKYYLDTRVNCAIEILQRGGSALNNIQQVCFSWVEDACHKEGRGCFIVNTVGQFGSSDPQVKILTEKALGYLREALTAEFSRAQELGEVIPTLPASQLGSLLLATGNGLLLHSRSVSNIREHTNGAFTAFLSMVSSPSNN